MNGVKKGAETWTPIWSQIRYSNSRPWVGFRKVAQKAPGEIRSESGATPSGSLWLARKRDETARASSAVPKSAAKISRGRCEPSPAWSDAPPAISPASSATCDQRARTAKKRERTLRGTICVIQVFQAGPVAIPKPQ